MSNQSCHLLCTLLTSADISIIPTIVQRNAYAGITPHTVVTGGHAVEAAFINNTQVCMRRMQRGARPRSRPCGVLTWLWGGASAGTV